MDTKYQKQSINKMMKNIFYSIIIGALIASCGGAETGPLADLIEEKDSLVSISKDLSARITEIDQLINEMDSTFEDRLLLVTYESIAPSKFAHYFNIHGVVESDKTAMLYPEMGAIIKNMKVKEGSRVSAGQTLAKLDASMVNSQMTELETALELATTIFEKQERLWNQKIGSEIEFLQAKNRKESIESSMATLQSQMRMTSVRAPYSGIVDEIFPKVGEMANPMSPMFRIINNKIVYVQSEVSESHLKDVRIGTPVEVVFGSLQDTVESKISEISDYINPENRSFKVKVNLDQSKGNYLPNLLAGMKIQDYVSENAIVIRSALVQQTSQGEDFVYLLKQENGQYLAERVNVKIGKEYEGMSEILSGLNEGDLIISKGARSVRSGQRIRITDNN